MPASPPNHALRHLATAGNAAALFAVIVILANARTLFQPQPTRLFPQGLAIAQPDPKATRAILVIMDALRADSSEDAALMPNLNRLAARGIRGTARVKALIPSTVAGLRAIVEGTVVAPAEFVHDFHAARAPGGGILEAVRAAGTRSFVAGPSLWCDLYAPWIDECVVTESIAESDALLVEPAIAACADPRWHLVVVHLSAADTAAWSLGPKGTASPPIF